ncbi:hypothetical protein BC477_02710 [Clavibacter michiganensis subsp. michiganensis]|uniref:Uncharacterized protein n=1 Tax=Clavibacter michiganensis subsp. michiganensis TaxID=33013 RepID=A0A251XJD7_CLAMM|nr:hypothetical protein BC477_02710 [Clavibacter michiganensis subsp. michiganensis]OUE03622.1 hypothetical protein CMMCAS07_01645 [Clavibacter michiganensis subsp. michiganensis]
MLKLDWPSVNAVTPASRRQATCCSAWSSSSSTTRSIRASGRTASGCCSSTRLHA